MASKASRKRKAKLKVRRSTAQVLFPEDLESVPATIRRIIENSERLRDYILAAGGNLDTAAPLALNDAIVAATEIVDLARPYDIFDVLENVRLSLTPMNPDTYKESEEEPGATLIELCAAILATRGKRDGSSPKENGHRARSDEVIDSILRALRECARAGGFVPMMQLLSQGTPMATIQRGAVTREIFVRNLVYTHMLEDTLRDLFDEPTIETLLRSSCGCTASDVRKTFHAMIDLNEAGWNQRFEVLHEFERESRKEWFTFKSEPERYQLDPGRREELLDLWAKAWTDPGDATNLDPQTIAAVSGVDMGTTVAVLDLFSYTLEERDHEEVTREFFGGRSPFRNRPLLREAGGSTVVAVHAGALMPAIQPRLEDELKVHGHWETYHKHRGNVLEVETLNLIRHMLPSGYSHHAFKYFVPDPQAPTPQTVPSHYTKLVEGDGLIVIDDVAVVIEAKSGSLSVLARTGAEASLSADLRKIVTSASEQAERTRERIEKDGGLRLQDGPWIDLAHIREIHSIAVSLEDLSGIGTVTSELVLAGLLNTPHLPWIVSVHDLRVISDLGERPTEFLLYLRRRTEPEVTRTFYAIDELDYFLEFYQSGLYVEPDPERREAELPQLGEVRVATVRRYKNQKPTMLTSRTDQLDAWYLYEGGERTEPAPKPVFRPNERIAELVDWLVESDKAGWLRVGATLFDASGILQRKLGGIPIQLAKTTRLDGAPHNVTMVGGSRNDDSYVLVFATRGLRESQTDALSRMTYYLEAKKHQLQLAFGSLLLFNCDETATPLGFVYDSTRPGRYPALDARVRELGLVPPSRMNDSLRQLPGKASGRVTPSSKNTRA